MKNKSEFFENVFWLWKVVTSLANPKLMTRNSLPPSEWWGYDHRNYLLISLLCEHVLLPCILGTFCRCTMIKYWAVNAVLDPTCFNFAMSSVSFVTSGVRVPQREDKVTWFSIFANTWISFDLTALWFCWHQCQSSRDIYLSQILSESWTATSC